MKKFYIISSLMTVLFLSLQANFGFWFSPGFNENNRRNQTGLSIAFGMRERLFQFWGFGAEFGLIDNADISSADVYDFGYYHIPEDYIYIGKKYVGPQWGFDIIGFINPTDLISLYGSGGLYFRQYGDMMFNEWLSIYHPGYGELHYEIEKAYSAGIHLNFPVNYMTSLIVGTGYHSVRGGLISFGFSFIPLKYRKY